MGSLLFVLWFTLVMMHFPYMVRWARDGKPLLAYKERWRKLLSNQSENENK